jgi:CRP-like cAMP-binding protein
MSTETIVVCRRTVESRMQALPENPFFRGLTSEQLNLIVPLFVRFSVPAGTAIFKQGDKALHLFLIVNGAVTIQYKPYDGPMITLSHLESGEIFGWSSVIGGQTYTSDAISTTEVEALRVRGSDLVRLCAEHPKAGYAILDKLAEAVSPRWTYARQQIQSILTNSVELENTDSKR